MAENLNESDEVIFKKCVSNDTLRNESVFAMKKKKDGPCIFLDENNKCEIQKF